MSVEGWVRWCRSHTAWVWTINTFVATLVCAWLDTSGSDVSITYGDGVALPGNVLFLHVLAVVTPVLMGLTLMLLVGVLWSRAIRSARLAFLPTLVALLAAMILLSQVGIHVIWTALMPDPPAWIIEFSMDMVPWRRAAFVCGLWLVAFGAVALLIRAFRVHVLRSAAPLSSQTE